MAKSLNDLKKTPTPGVAGVAPVVVPPVASDAKPKKVKEDKPKMDPEELKAMRLKNLKPKIKSPEKAAREQLIKDHITRILTANPPGVTATTLRTEIFPGISEEHIKSTEKEIRFIARGMGCTRTQLENSRKVLYHLPK